MHEVVIVQPWFSAIGHPAQSVLNTARALSSEANVSYLVSKESRDSFYLQRDALNKIACVHEFSVKTHSVREGTWKALLELCRLADRKRFDHIFFFDAHLVLLATLWGLFYPYLKPKRLSQIYLMGPERIQRSRLVAFLVNRFLMRKEVSLYLRTEELVQAWRQAFPNLPSDSIRYLPSLELTEETAEIHVPMFLGRLKFGVYGQIRPGKGLDWLVPMFIAHPELGELRVEGSFNNALDEDAMATLKAFAGFRNEYLSEETMLRSARQQHYLLMLYDNWDARMEGAVLYLAARAGRPVITYGGGWCERQISLYGNGRVAPRNREEIATFLQNLPLPGSEAYKNLLAGVEEFRKAHSAASLRQVYVRELMD